MYDVVTPRPMSNGNTHWFKIGVAFDSRNKDGFTLRLNAAPLPDPRSGDIVLYVKTGKSDGKIPNQSNYPYNTINDNTVVDNDSDEIPF